VIFRKISKPEEDQSRFRAINQWLNGTSPQDVDDAIGVACLTQMMFDPKVPLGTLGQHIAADKTISNKDKMVLREVFKKARSQ